jgi:hypothetical protein
LTVKGQTQCGTLGSAYSYSVVSPLAVATPLRITPRTGSYNACRGDTISYTVTPGSTGISQSAVSVFRWTRPSNTSIYRSNLDSSIITLQFNNGYAGGNLTVFGQSACGGVSTVKTEVLTHQKCMNEIFAKSTNKISVGIIEKSFTANIYPNPSNTTFELIIQDLYGLSDEYKVRLLDMGGRVLQNFAIKPAEKLVFGNGLKSGTYVLEIFGKDQRVSKRIIKF